MPLRYSFQASKTAPQQAPQPQLASKPAPKQPVPVPDQPQEQVGPCGSTPPSTAPKAKQQSRADADKEARDELMQRRDWSYKEGYKPRWIMYCTTRIAPMIVEGAEVKPAGARAPQDHVAVIIPNDQWSPSQQGEDEEEEEDDWSEFMSSCQVFSAKSKAYEELDKWQSWWETYEADEIVDLCPDPKTMRMSPSKPPTPKKKKPQGDPPAQPPAPPTRRQGTCRSCSTSRRLGQKTTDPNGRRSGRSKWWSKPLRRSLNDSARYIWYSAPHKVHSARCKHVARTTLSVPVRTCTVAHFSDLSDSVFACVLGWMSNKECF